MVASEIPSSISLCVKSFFRSTISSCTTEIRAINPPNAVLPILRKLKNRNHRGGPFIKSRSFFFCPQDISLWTVYLKVVEYVFGHSAALILSRFQIAKPFDQINERLLRRFFETGNSNLFQDGCAAFGRFKRHERCTKLLDLGRRNLWRRNDRCVGHLGATRNHAAAVLLPSTADARKRGDNA